MARILVYTCKQYSWSLRPFLHLLGVYWSQEQGVAIGGCPRFDTPPNVEWLGVESRVKERWSDGLIECLKAMTDDVFIWMLEDYWLCRTVDHAAITSLADYMTMHPDILKIDLTGDRLHSGHAVDAGYWGHVDLVETPWTTPYQWSTQAALWNRQHLLANLRPEMSPWDFELRDTKLDGLRVLGTRQWPVRYVNGLGMGLGRHEYRTEHVRSGLGGTTIERIDPAHVETMKAAGLLQVPSA